jgi:endonuclease/exonuclease/phosphatase family metal-dependent hydrolase
MNRKRIFLGLLLAFIVMFQMSCHAPLKTPEGMPEPLLKIMTYNVLYGFNHHQRIPLAADWINKQNPDVLALQELNGFNEQKLSDIAAQWNHNHAVILKEQGFPVGLTSKTPIKVLEKRTEGFTHGYMHCNTAGIDFLVVHLDPHNYLQRQKEADMIVAKAKKLLADNKRMVVMGDFNSFSSSDKERLDQKPELQESQKKRKNLNNGQFDYSVMERFEKSGLIDICDKYLPATDAGRFTFPTKSMEGGRKPEDQMKFARRIDYIFLSQNLAKQCDKVFIPREDAQDSISDHFPVIITLRK